MTENVFDTLTQKLAAFCSAPDFRTVAVDFFKTLGYESSRTLRTDDPVTS